MFNRDSQTQQAVRAPVACGHGDVENAARDLHEEDTVLANELQVTRCQVVVVLVQDGQVHPAFESAVQHTPPLIDASL